MFGLPEVNPGLQVYQSVVRNLRRSDVKNQFTMTVVSFYIYILLVI